MNRFRITMNELDNDSRKPDYLSNWECLDSEYKISPLTQNPTWDPKYIYRRVKFCFLPFNLYKCISFLDYIRIKANLINIGCNVTNMDYNLSKINYTCFSHGEMHYLEAGEFYQSVSLSEIHLYCEYDGDPHKVFKEAYKTLKNGHDLFFTEGVPNEFGMTIWTMIPPNESPVFHPGLDYKLTKVGKSISFQDKVPFSTINEPNKMFKFRIQLSEFITDSRKAKYLDNWECVSPENKCTDLTQDPVWNMNFIYRRKKFCIAPLHFYKPEVSFKDFINLKANLINIGCNVTNLDYNLCKSNYACFSHGELSYVQHTLIQSISQAEMQLYCEPVDDPHKVMKNAYNKIKTKGLLLFTAGEPNSQGLTNWQHLSDYSQAFKSNNLDYRLVVDGKPFDFNVPISFLTEDDMQIKDHNATQTPQKSYWVPSVDGPDEHIWEDTEDNHRHVNSGMAFTKEVAEDISNRIRQLNRTKHSHILNMKLLLPDVKSAMLYFVRNYVHEYHQDFVYDFVKNHKDLPQELLEFLVLYLKPYKLEYDGRLLKDVIKF